MLLTWGSVTSYMNKISTFIEILTSTYPGSQLYSSLQWKKLQYSHCRASPDCFAAEPVRLILLVRNQQQCNQSHSNQQQCSHINTYEGQVTAEINMFTGVKGKSTDNRVLHNTTTAKLKLANQELDWQDMLHLVRRRRLVKYIEREEGGDKGSGKKGSKCTTPSQCNNSTITVQLHLSNYLPSQQTMATLFQTHLVQFPGILSCQSEIVATGKYSQTHCRYHLSKEPMLS